MKFSISPAVFEKLPTACFGVVAVLDAVPSPEADAAIAARLTEAVTDCQAALAGVALKESPEILPYREAFRALGQNPNKYPCSIEALLTRIAKGKGMPSINTLVDLGNAVSLRHRLPIGAHDIATFRDGVLTGSCPLAAANRNSPIPAKWSMYRAAKCVPGAGPGGRAKPVRSRPRPGRYSIRWMASWITTGKKCWQPGTNWQSWQRLCWARR